MTQVLLLALLMAAASWALAERRRTRQQAGTPGRPSRPVRRDEKRAGRSLSVAVARLSAAAPALSSPKAWALPAGFTRAEALGSILFAGSLAVFAVTRLAGLEQFPINFFADEANQVLTALDLVKRGFRDAQGTLFPMYFRVFFFENPDFSVYFHAITASWFGVSIGVARATCALLAAGAAGTMALVMRDVFGSRFWWATTLLVGVAPAWFLFSRTAFDAAALASLYALFIACYLLYRYRSPHWIFPAVLLAAASFYAYPSGQPGIALLGAFLVISDARYHWQQRRLFAAALALTALAAVPFTQFQRTHPFETALHLRAVNSYWLQDIPQVEKVKRWASIYLELLSPGYWFFHSHPDLIRHEMKGYSFMPLIELPLFLAGAVRCLQKARESRHRTLLAALLAAPVGAAVADPGILRVLAFVAPATLVSMAGLDWLLVRLTNPRSVAMVSLALFGVLSVASAGMLRDALANGPTWYSDYTLYGMQWGAKQVFQDTVPRLLRDNPDARIYVTGNWANGTDIFASFFLPGERRVQVRDISAWLLKREPLPANAIFVAPPEEYEKARSSPKLKNVRVLETIPYPSGPPGFYVLRMEYADGADTMFAAEKAELRQLVTEQISIGGQTAELSHTKFDIGNAQSMFDGDLFTVTRGVEANPMVLDFNFEQPRPLPGLSMYLGKANVKVLARLYPAGGSSPNEYSATFRYAASTGPNAGPPAQMSFDRGPSAVKRLYLEVGYPEAGEDAHVHVFELQLG